MKLGALLFLLALGYAYVFAFLMVKTWSGLTPARVQATYVPTPGMDEMQMPTESHATTQPLDLGKVPEMQHTVDTNLLIQDSHIHIMIYAIVAALLTLIILGLDWPAWWRDTVIVAAFASGALDFAGQWLMKFGLGGFAWLTILSGLGHVPGLSHRPVLDRPGAAARPLPEERLMTVIKLALAAAALGAAAHPTPKVVLVKHADFIRQTLAGATQYFVRTVSIGKEDLAAIRKAERLHPGRSGRAVLPRPGRRRRDGRRRPVPAGRHPARPARGRAHVRPDGAIARAMVTTATVETKPWVQEAVGHGAHEAVRRHAAGDDPRKALGSVEGSSAACRSTWPS